MRNATLGLVAALVLAAGLSAETVVPPVARSHFNKAEVLREEGRLEDAAQQYVKAIEAHGLYLEAHAGYLAALRGLGDMSPAWNLYSKLVEEHKGSIELKAFQAATQDPDEALTRLGELCRDHKDNVRVWLELARVQLAIGKTKDAKKSAEQSIKAKETPLGHVLLGDVHFAADNKTGYSKARKEYQTAIELDASYVPAHLRLALAWHRMGGDKNTKKGLAVLGKLVSEDNLPRLVAGHWMFAMIRRDQGKYDKAVEAVDKVLSIDKDDFLAIMMKGHFLLEWDKPAEAAKIFEVAVKQRASSAEALFCLGWAHEKAGDAPELQDAQRKERWNAAADAYMKCAEMDPTVRPRDSLGFAFLLGDNHQDAVIQFRRAKDIDPKFAPTLNNLGLADDIADNRAEAKKRYEYVLNKIDKQNVRALVMLALDLWIDGSAPKAIKNLEKALKIKPDDDLAWTFLGDVHYDNRKYKNAIKAYKKATEFNDKNFIAWYHMGIAYFDIKKDEDCDRCLRKALEVKADPPAELLLRLAEVNEEEALNRLDKTLEYYQLYVELGGTEEWVPERIEELKEILEKKKK